MSLTSGPLSSTEEDTAFDPFAYPEEVPINTLAELRSECPVADRPREDFDSSSAPVIM